MQTIEAIRTRRNVKLFKPDPIEETDLLAWLEAASCAPNHRMTEPWEVLRVGPETRAKLNHKTDFGGAPIVIAVLSRPATTALDRDEHVMAAACFVQNLMLAAHEAGVGTFWSSLGAQSRSRGILAVPEHYDVIGLLGIGYPEQVPEIKPRTPIAFKIAALP